jgi:hypothetical protein
LGRSSPGSHHKGHARSRNRRRDCGGGLRPNFPDEALSCATFTPFQIWASVLCPGSSETVSSTTNLEIDMSKPRLLLIHCSNGVRPAAKHRQRGHSFRPLVIHGGARARSVPRESSWEAALELINLGFLISHGNYLAFLQASITVLEAYNRTDPEKTS